MKTEINDFWNCFSLVQMDLTLSNNAGDLVLRDTLCGRLDKKAIALHPKLSLFLLFQINDFGINRLIFLTKGKFRLKKIAAEVLAEAPSFPFWQYEAGLNPYKHSIITLCANNRFLGTDISIYQIYFAVQKIYKTTNKLQLILYLEMNKQLSKSELHNAMHPILLCYLGDAYYQKHISRYRIVRRKYSKIRFVPLDEIKYLIQFKSFN